MKSRPTLTVFKEALSGWSNHQAMTQAAAIAYYTIFSIAPLLIIAIAVAGWLFGDSASQGSVFSAMQSFLGKDGAQAIQSMVHAASKRPHAGLIATILGVITLFIGASGVFQQLQGALNLIWEVQPAPGRGISAAIRQRFLSFAMILVIAFILMVSLFVTAALSAVGNYLSSSLPGGTLMWQVLNFVISFSVISLLFASIFKILPDVRLRWKDVVEGALVTAFLFTVGKHLIGLYLGLGSTASAYGAAGSLVMVLLWVNYSAMIVLLGVEVSRAYMKHKGTQVVPTNGAVLIQPSGSRAETPASEAGKNTGIAA